MSRTSRIAELTAGATLRSLILLNKKARTFFRELSNEPIRSGKFIRKQCVQAHADAKKGTKRKTPAHSVPTLERVHNPGILRFFLVKRTTPSRQARYEAAKPCWLPDASSLCGRRVCYIT